MAKKYRKYEQLLKDWTPERRARVKAEVDATIKELRDREANKPTIIRIDPDLLKRIDGGAWRLGISRDAFIASSAAEKLERMKKE